MILFFFFFLPLIQILTKRKSNFQRKQSETYNQNDKKQINKLTELLPIYVLPSEKKGYINSTLTNENQVRECENYLVAMGKNMSTQAEQEQGRRNRLEALIDTGRWKSVDELLDLEDELEMWLQKWCLRRIDLLKRK